MSIDFPTTPPIVPIPTALRTETRWNQTIAGFEADHIILNEYYPTVPTCIPKAKKSLTVCFKAWPKGTYTQDVPDDHGFDRIYERVHSIADYTDPLSCIDKLRLIGITRRHEDDPRSMYGDLQESKVVLFFRRFVRDLMHDRLHAKNRKDLKLAIMPDPGPESEAAAVWHTYKVAEEVAE